MKINPQAEKPSLLSPFTLRAYCLWTIFIFVGHFLFTGRFAFGWLAGFTIMAVNIYAVSIICRSAIMQNSVASAVFAIVLKYPILIAISYFFLIQLRNELFSFTVGVVSAVGITVVMASKSFLDGENRYRDINKEQKIGSL
jgi:hypothetical protein